MIKYNLLAVFAFVFTLGLLSSTGYAERVYYETSMLDEDTIRIELKVEGQDLSANVYPAFYELREGRVLTVGYEMSDGKYHKPYFDFDLRKTRDTLMIVLYGVGEDVPKKLSDIEDIYEKEHILHLYDSKIVEGKESGEFGINENVTRAEFVTMVCRTLGIEPVMRESDFEDLKGHWAKGYLLAGVDMGFVDVYEDTYIFPNQKVNLAHASVIVDNAFDLQVHTVDEYDKIRQGMWFSDAVKKMFDARLLYVFESIYYFDFDEEKNLTRADVAMIISRAKLNQGIIGTS